VAVLQLFIDKAMIQLEVRFYNNLLTESGIQMELVRLNKMCLNETYI
jgi:hypothetical protein